MTPRYTDDDEDEFDLDVITQVTPIENILGRGTLASRQNRSTPTTLLSDGTSEKQVHKQMRSLQRRYWILAAVTVVIVVALFFFVLYRTG